MKLNKVFNILMILLAVVFLLFNFTPLFAHLPGGPGDYCWTDYPGAGGGPGRYYYYDCNTQECNNAGPAEKSCAKFVMQELE